MALLLPYLGSDASLADVTLEIGAQTRVFHCPAERQAPPGYNCYGMSWLLGDDGVAYQDEEGRDAPEFNVFRMVTRRSSKMLVADSYWIANPGYADVGIWRTTTQGLSGEVGYRHLDGAANLLLADGSAAAATHQRMLDEQLF